MLSEAQPLLKKLTELLLLAMLMKAISCKSDQEKACKGAPSSTNTTCVEALQIDLSVIGSLN